MSLNPPAESCALLLTAADLMSTSLCFAARTLPTRPTPCSEWRLGELVRHVAASASTLTEVIARAPRAPIAGSGCAHAEASIQELRQTVLNVPADNPAIGLTSLAGAFELTIHAWDINTAVEGATDLPDDHFRRLVRLAPIVLAEINRDGLFGPRLPPPPPGGTDTERLLALFGRRPT